VSLKHVSVDDQGLSGARAGEILALYIRRNDGNHVLAADGIFAGAPGPGAAGIRCVRVTWRGGYTGGTDAGGGYRDPPGAVEDPDLLAGVGSDNANLRHVGLELVVEPAGCGQTRTCARRAVFSQDQRLPDKRIGGGRSGKGEGRGNG